MLFNELPFAVLQSKIFSSEHLLKLATVREIPAEPEVWEQIQIMYHFQKISIPVRDALHQRAAELLDENKVEMAWKVILCHK